MSLLVFNSSYCCLSLYMSSHLMSLFQGHAASWNFTLTGSLKVSSFQTKFWLLSYLYIKHSSDNSVPFLQK